jgi:hypothetical protein
MSEPTILREDEIAIFNDDGTVTIKKKDDD